MKKENLSNTGVSLQEPLVLLRETTKDNQPFFQEKDKRSYN